MLTERVIFSSPGGFSLPRGSAAHHCGAAAGSSVHPSDERGGLDRGGPAVAVPGRRLEHPQVGQTTENTFH